MLAILQFHTPLFFLAVVRPAFHHFLRINSRLIFCTSRTVINSTLNFCSSRVPHPSRILCERMGILIFCRNFRPLRQTKKPRDDSQLPSREPVAGLVSLTMTCLGYLLVMSS